MYWNLVVSQYYKLELLMLKLWKVLETDSNCFNKNGTLEISFESNEKFRVVHVLYNYKSHVKFLRNSMTILQVLKC